MHEKFSFIHLNTIQVQIGRLKNAVQDKERHVGGSDIQHAPEEADHGVLPQLYSASTRGSRSWSLPTATLLQVTLVEYEHSTRCQNAFTGLESSMMWRKLYVHLLHCA